MGRKKIETVIAEKIHPFRLNESGLANISQLVKQYPYNLLIECIEIGVARYFRYDQEGCLTRKSVEMFMEKIGGIAYNKSRSPIDQEIYHLKNKGKCKFAYWDLAKAEKLLREYVKELAIAGWSEEEIVKDLQGESSQMMNTAKNWSEWSSNILQWIKDIQGWNKDHDKEIKQSGVILPTELFDTLSPNVQLVCKQINASYENNLFDCAAVMMRRLLESLLVLSYQKAGIEADITDKSGLYHVSLDKIIKNAEQNKALNLSANTRKDMALFKNLGNYSAHKIWYNCTQGDIKPHILKYRVIIEELMYKAGVK